MTFASFGTSTSLISVYASVQLEHISSFTALSGGQAGASSNSF